VFSPVAKVLQTVDRPISLATPRASASAMGTVTDDGEPAQGFLSAFTSLASDSSALAQLPNLERTVPDPPISTSTHSQELEESKSVTYWQGVSLIIGRQVGGGIFSVPALVCANSGSVGLSLIVWIVSGCVAYLGACNDSEGGTL
jgi:hypothetical protein